MVESKIKAKMVGIAIATFNSASVLRWSLEPLVKAGFTVVLFDDGSTDGTPHIAQELLPEIEILKGDGNNWWGGSTAAAVRRCFERGCEYVLMLNPDARIGEGDIWRLVERAHGSAGTLVGALVTTSDGQKIAWGGSRREFVGGFLPIYRQKYLHRSGDLVEAAGRDPYVTDELHGRGVLVSREVYEKIGTLDHVSFPHYGADNDYSWTAQRAGFRLEVVPQARARLIVRNSGMSLRGKPWTRERVAGVIKGLRERKNGEALKVVPRLYFKHLPWHIAMTSSVFSLSVTAWRRLSSHSSDE